jgi:peroxiredoxin
MDEFRAEVKTLLQVGAVVDQVSASQDATAWIASQRASAQVSIQSDLEAPLAPEISTVMPDATVEIQTADTAESSTGSKSEVDQEAPVMDIDPPQTDIQQPDLPTGIQPGQVAPDFTLTTPDGTSITLSQLRGQAVVLNFWATWCPVCRRELPEIEAAYQKYREQGVVILGVDQQESPDEVAEFMAQNGLNYPTVIDPQGEVGKTYQVIGIPTAVFIDAQGVVRARHIGPLTVSQFDEYVDPLLPETAAGPASIPPLEEPGLLAAPDFTLADSTGTPITLSDYRGKSVVLVFYRGKT